MCDAALSQDVKDKPHGVEVLGEKLVLFRESSGKVGADGKLHQFTTDLPSCTYSCSCIIANR